MAPVLKRSSPWISLILISLTFPSSVTINPSPAYTNDTLTGTYTYNDLDSDSESGSTFKWFRNNIEITGQTSTTLTSSYFNKTDDIIFQVTPKDSYEFGNAVNSSTLTIQNLAPYITLQNTFINYTTEHSFNVTATAYDTDGANDLTSATITTTSGTCNQSSFTNININEKQAIFKCNGPALQSTNIQIIFTDNSGVSALTTQH